MSDKYSDRYGYDYDDKYRDRHGDDLYEDRYGGSSRRDDYYDRGRDSYESPRRSSRREYEDVPGLPRVRVDRHVSGVNDLMSGGLDYGSSRLQDRSHLYEGMDKEFSTKAMIGKWYDSELYPRESAPYSSHAKAEKLRISAYDDDEEVGRHVWKKRDETRQKASLDNYNSSKDLRRNGIDSRDWYYPSSSSRHSKVSYPGDAHYVTESSVERTKSKYPRY
jgi:hypothetical protein